MNLKKELAAMEQMPISELQRKYATVFGEEPRSRHKAYLIRKIAWRLQANSEGGLSERAIARAAELADPADARVTPPREREQRRVIAPVATAPSTSLDPRLPPVGATITRAYKGRTLSVQVLADGFEYLGERYSSLSAIAKAVSGTHQNGFRFFKIEDKP
ncbi:MAG: DUF2924 domain-containing protein [Phycisphaerae bacterium]